MPIEYVTLAGSPKQMGQAHGEQFAERIAQFAEIRLARCIDEVTESGRRLTRDDVVSFCQSVLQHHRDYAPSVYEEFAGIAEAAGISPAMLMICNGLTDVVDPLACGTKAWGCTSWLIGPEATDDGQVLAGQSWDMHPEAADFIAVFRRQPAEGPASLVMSTIGCLSLVGINEAGIAVGNNNLKPTDARPGVMYLSMIHHALAQTPLAGAVNAITLAQRMSGHNYYLAGPEGEIVDIETTATRHEVVDPAGSFYVHTNHYLTAALREFEAEGKLESSHYRLDRMGKLLHKHVGEITAQTMMTLMADEQGHGDCRICRRDPADEAATCGAIVMSPQAGTMWAVQGPPSQNKFERFQL